MPYKDLRDWIQALEKKNELLRIKEEVKPEPDVGALARAVCDIEGPGIFAEQVYGYEIPLTICLHGSWRRSAMAIDLPGDAGRRQQVKAWIEAYDRYPVKSRVVNDAPCKDNTVSGEKVNLFQLPIPRLNINDASFYITKGICITRDIDSDWTNAGIYRMMLLGQNRIALSVQSTGQHIRQQWRKYMKAGKPMEMAVALGTEPVLPMVAGMKIPSGWNEFEFTGAVRKEPVELIMGETVSLLVPAQSEIILEGVIHTDKQVLEGPFGEHTGAYSGCYWTPVYEVKTITFRNKPIYDCLYLGKPYSECNYMSLLCKLAGVQRELKQMIPQITEMAYHTPDVYNVVIQGQWIHNGQPKRAMNAMWGSSFGIPAKMVTVVDEDVDPWDEKDVLWAIATRCQANKDIVIIPGCEGSLDPSKDPDDNSCKLGIDATKAKPPFYRHKPVNWIAPRETTQEWKEKILRQWHK